MRILPAVLQPLRRRLPILICALLLAVVAVFTWAAHDRFERALLDAGKDRVTSASQRLATTLGDRIRRGRADWTRLGADAAIARYLRTGDPHAAAVARAMLAYWRDSLPHVMAMELRDTRRVPLITVGQAPRPSDTDSAAHGGMIGPFFAVGDTAYYALSTPVLASHTDTLGYLTQYRRLVSTSATSQLIGGLIDPEAMVLLGNRRGDLWTDLTHAVPAPAANVIPGRALTIDGEGGEPSLAVAAAIDGTPWVALVAMPRRDLLAPAQDLLGALALLAAIVLAGGAVAAWLLSRQISGPLAEVTSAAEGIAKGDYTRRVAIARDDELGRLAAAFNLMADQVQESRHTLEDRVADRTQELERTLHELRMAQDELVRRERAAGETRYKRLVEMAQEGVWTLDAEGKTDYVNPRMAEIFGYTVEEMIGRTPYDFMDDDARPEAEQALARRRQGVQEMREVRFKRKDGSDVWTFLSGAPLLNDHGEYTGALAMVTDVTERRRLETQVRQSQKMEAVGQLAGGVAHDFNNLLTVIKGFTTFLLEDLDPSDPRHSDVREIDQAATRAAALTRQLLAFSRRQMLEPRLLDLNDVVAQFEKMLRRLIPSDIELRTRLDPQLAMIEADPGQLEQVLMNLAVNARDAMPDGGALTITTENAELGGQYVGDHIPVVAGKYVALLVADNGCGMDRATQSRIFEPFFTTKEKGKGTGLGLSTVYGIVKQTGGYVFVESEPGKGTTFRIYLPCAKPATPDAHAGVSTQAPARAGSETILLVEDDAAVRGMARRVLDRTGYRVLEATTGAEALRLCADSAERIDLIITDLVMPEMGGRELAEQVRAHRPTVLLLFMSGYTEDAVMQRSFLDRADAFLGKPFTPSTLTAKVREVLDRAPGGVVAGASYAAAPKASVARRFDG